MRHNKNYETFPFFFLCETKQFRRAQKQLTHAKLVQSGRHQSGAKEVPGSILTEGNLFSQLSLQFRLFEGL